MKLRYLIFPSIKAYIKRLVSSIVHHSSDIDSPYVSPKAVLGRNVKIAPLVKITKYAVIGDYTYVENNSEIASAIIGKYCSIGENCHIGVWQHPYSQIALSPIIYRKILKLNNKFYNDVPNKCQIGNDVWIGSNAVIMGGVTIGNGAIVGSGSVVTKDIPAYSIAVGVPARVLKYRFESENIKKLERLQWWNWSEDKIKEYKELFMFKSNWMDYVDKYLEE